MVGGIAGIEQQGEVDDRHVVPPGKDDLEAVVQFHRLSCRKGRLWELGDLGRPGRAVDGACPSRICGVGPHLHGQDAFVQPFDSGGVDVGDSRGPEVLLLPLVAVRAVAVHLAGGQDVRLAAEAPDALDAADEVRPSARLRAGQLGLRRSGIEERLEFLLKDGLHLGQSLARLGGDGDDELAGELARPDGGADIGGNLIVVDEAPVEAGTLADAQDVTGQGEMVDGLVLHGGDVPHLVDPPLRHAILKHHTGWLCPARGIDVGLDQGRPGGDVGEVLLDPGLDVFGFNVAGNDENRVRGAVPGVEPLVDVLERGGVQVLQQTGPRVAVGMAVRIGVLADGEFRLAVRLVQELTDFVLDNATLLVELGLAHRRLHVPHAVRFHPQRHFERRGRHDLEVVRAVSARRAVHSRGADAVERLEVVVVEVLAAVEHQVLEQVRELFPAGFFVGGADAVPDVDSDDRGLAILVDDQSQAVVEHVLRVGDVYDVLRRGARLRGSTAGIGRDEQAKSKGGTERSFHWCLPGSEKSPLLAGRIELKETQRVGSGCGSRRSVSRVAWMRTGGDPDHAAGTVLHQTDHAGLALRQPPARGPLCRGLRWTGAATRWRFWVRESWASQSGKRSAAAES